MRREEKNVWVCSVVEIAVRWAEWDGQKSTKIIEVVIWCRPFFVLIR
jgi:hypothetical protein